MKFYPKIEVPILKDSKSSCYVFSAYIFEDTAVMDELPVIGYYVMRKGFWDRQGANITSRQEEISLWRVCKVALSSNLEANNAFSP